MQLSTTLRHLIRSALLYIQPNICQPSRGGSKIHSQSRFTCPEWHIQSLPESQHDPRPRSVSPFPRHLFLWTCPACHQDSLTKAGVKRGLCCQGAPLVVFIQQEKKGLMHGGSLPAISFFACQCSPTEKASDGKDAQPSNAIDLTDYQCNPTLKASEREDAQPSDAINLTDSTDRKASLPSNSIHNKN